MLSKVLDTTTGALAANTAVILDTTLGSNLSAGFLSKRMHYHLSFVPAATAVGEDVVIIGIASGDPTVAEIAAALAETYVNPNDATVIARAAEKRLIWWETLRTVGFITPNISPVDITHQRIIDEMFSLGGGKGLPMLEEKGAVLFAYNPDSATALANGILVKGIYAHQGVWLSD